MQFSSGSSSSSSLSYCTAMESISSEKRQTDMKTTKSNKRLEVQGFVGFSTFPIQVSRRAFITPFKFNILFVGESGLGKSTFINTLFCSDIFKTTNDIVSKTSSVNTSDFIINENGAKVSLTIIDTPGFGDSIDNRNTCDAIKENIINRLKEYQANDESLERQTSFPDKRIHACIYFINPSGHDLKSLDLHFTKMIHDKVNIIPVIGKADVLTKEELTSFKSKVTILLCVIFLILLDYIIATRLCYNLRRTTYLCTSFKMNTLMTIFHLL